MQIISTGKTVTGNTPVQLVKTSAVNFFVQVFVNDAWETLMQGTEEETHTLFNRMVGAN